MADTNLIYLFDLGKTLVIPYRRSAPELEWLIAPLLTSANLIHQYILAFFTSITKYLIGVAGLEGLTSHIGFQTPPVNCPLNISPRLP